MAVTADDAIDETNVNVETNATETSIEAEVVSSPVEDELQPSTSKVDVSDGPEVEMCLPPPSDDEEGIDDDGEEGGKDEDDVDATNDGPEVDVCVPPPDDEEEDQSEFPYPAVGEYPSDDVVPYPVDVEYPVDDAYGDNEPGDMVAAVAPYPSGEDVVFGITNDAEDQMEIQEAMPPVEEEKKKQFDGDKAVVGFMPSHLRVKRKTAKQTKKHTTAKQPGVTTSTQSEGEAAKEKYSVADDYNRFMEEIGSELR